MWEKKKKNENIEGACLSAAATPPERSMGRVRSYKKVKAVDFFHEKKKWGQQKSDKHDLAPTGKTGRKRVRLIGERVGSAAAAADSAAKRAKRDGKRRKGGKKLINGKLQKAAVTPEELAAAEREKLERAAAMRRQPGETLKEYRLRLRRRTHEVLIRETKAKTKTAKKRKEFMVNKKRAKKERADKIAAATGAAVEPEDSDDEAAYIRSQHADRIAAKHATFGATNDRPPSLNTFDVAKKLKKKGLWNKGRKKDNRLMFLPHAAVSSIESASDAMSAPYQPRRVEEEERELVTAQVKERYAEMKRKRQQAFERKVRGR